ncbi:LysR family transcriptional regulator [Dyella halodurans]|uniref:LysR substrate-binding domain-containing protein n=1 Tax=Dyella halodurans TaxID=1920171 RepID=A0ABV9C3D1_9GAMM|nr:LysR family transcriptional regulator [Dyella halodurans]
MPRRFDDMALGSIELFCLAAELGGFTAAAATAGVTPAAVSRSVARLEERMGVRLFVRTTRHMRLTDAGRVYYEQCRQALDQLVEAERVAAGEQLHPVGTLRISAPTTYAHYRLLPLLPEFRELHPEVRVEIHVGNRNVDFSEEGFDLAIRVRSPGDSGLIVRHLEDAALVVVGSPTYLARRGTPNSLDDLREHDCIQFDLPSSGRRITWLFKDQGNDIELRTEGGYSLSEDVLGGVTLARHGAGLFQTYRFVVEGDLRAGRLVEVLQQASGRSRPFNLLYPSSRHVPFRVRSFIDFLVNKMT